MTLVDVLTGTDTCSFGLWLPAIDVLTDTGSCNFGLWLPVIDVPTDIAAISVYGCPLLMY